MSYPPMNYTAFSQKAVPKTLRLFGSTIICFKYKKVKGSATYNFNIICILTTKSTTNIL